MVLKFVLDRPSPGTEAPGIIFDIIHAPEDLPNGSKVGTVLGVIATGPVIINLCEDTVLPRYHAPDDP